MKRFAVYVGLFDNYTFARISSLCLVDATTSNKATEFAQKELLSGRQNCTIESSMVIEIPDK